MSKKRNRKHSKNRKKNSFFTTSLPLDSVDTTYDSVIKLYKQIEDSLKSPALLKPFSFTLKGSYTYPTLSPLHNDDQITPIGLPFTQPTLTEINIDDARFQKEECPWCQGKVATCGCKEEAEDYADSFFNIRPNWLYERIDFNLWEKYKNNWLGRRKEMMA